MMQFQKKQTVPNSKLYRDCVAYTLGGEVPRYSSVSIPSMQQFEEKALQQKNKRKFSTTTTVAHEDIGTIRVFSKKKCGEGTSYEVLFPNSKKREWIASSDKKIKTIS